MSLLLANSFFRSLRAENIYSGSLFLDKLLFRVPSSSKLIFQGPSLRKWLFGAPSSRQQLFQGRSSGNGYSRFFHPENHFSRSLYLENNLFNIPFVENFDSRSLLANSFFRALHKEDDYFEPSVWKTTITRPLFWKWLFQVLQIENSYSRALHLENDFFELLRLDNDCSRALLLNLTIPGPFR